MKIYIAALLLLFATSLMAEHMQVIPTFMVYDKRTPSQATFCRATGVEENSRQSLLCFDLPLVTIKTLLKDCISIVDPQGLEIVCNVIEARE